MCIVVVETLKGSSDPSQFIFEINVGKSRIRHTTTVKLNDEFLDRHEIDYHSDPTLSDIDFKNKLAWV